MIKKSYPKIIDKICDITTEKQGHSPNNKSFLIMYVFFNLSIRQLLNNNAKWSFHQWPSGFFDLFYFSQDGTNVWKMGQRELPEFGSYEIDWFIFMFF